MTCHSEYWKSLIGMVELGPFRLHRLFFRRKRIKNPFRIDRTPTCTPFLLHGWIYFKDWATLDIFDSISAILAILEPGEILTILSLNKPVSGEIFNEMTTSARRVKKSSQIALFRAVEWNRKTIDYWKSYGIRISWLIDYGVAPISAYMIKMRSYENLDMCFVIPSERRSYMSVKYYSPYGRIKHMSHGVSGSTIFLADIMEGGGSMIIASSFKDAACINSLLGKNVAIALNSESSFPVEMIGFIVRQKRINRIYVLYDSDEPGKKLSRMLAERLVNHIAIPVYVVMLPEEEKDIADYAKKYGNKFTAKLKFLIKHAKRIKRHN